MIHTPSTNQYQYTTMTDYYNTAATSDLTLADLRRYARTYGWLVKVDGDELEVYRSGHRGNASYFTDDRDDALATIKAQATSLFTTALCLSSLTDEATFDALIEWYSTHRAAWHRELRDAWYSGNYGRFASKDVSSILQRLRNHFDGHAVINEVYQTLNPR